MVPGSDGGGSIRGFRGFRGDEALAAVRENWAADQLVDAGRSPEWPVCPVHRVRHGLHPQSRDGGAVWVCPEGDQVIGEIGALGRPGGPAS